jgi:hypothetical protein
VSHHDSAAGLVIRVLAHFGPMLRADEVDRIGISRRKKL